MCSCPKLCAPCLQVLSLYLRHHRSLHFLICPTPPWSAIGTVEGAMTRNSDHCRERQDAIGAFAFCLAVVASSRWPTPLLGSRRESAIKSLRSPHTPYDSCRLILRNSSGSGPLLGKCRTTRRRNGLYVSCTRYAYGPSSENCSLSICLPASRPRRGHLQL